MTVGLHFGFSFITRKFVRVCVICLERHNVIRVRPFISSLRSFGTDPNDSDRDNSSSDASATPASTFPQFSQRASLFGRRRPLSPLERVSQLLPEDSLSQDVWDLRDTRNTEVQNIENKTGSDVEQDSKGKEREDATSPGQVTLEQQGSFASHHVCVPAERPIFFGEALLAEYRRNRRLEFRKMFQLQKGLKLHSNWGLIPHEHMEGRPSGSVLHTSMGIPILIRRPSLEEFTLFMKRGPAIAYPKDASAMLTMMDVTEGDCVLESGSGSGAMSLFLSRAVGSKGSVLSVEIREDHHRRAVLNYQRWCSSWIIQRGEEWPDNVHFYHGDLISASPLLAGRGFNSVALDMVNPHLALPAVVPHLHSGSVCAVYQANITQVIELMEGLRCSKLPLVCERIVEVQYRDWLVAPSLKKDGTFNRRIAPREDDDEYEPSEDAEGDRTRTDPVPFGDVPYIARPHPEQTGHTAFLVKLRKILK
ncbi:tRNA (adenine(58)-N(1))-methyltransferase, mitochondrial-like [Xyrauchen texanus]|uniref:tRNA (adenine(58)-N(1))-methyltransferase, mitochondrial-like n=1 Tax=Xyrauchen texanus TaxID=154827 RepID=UPI002242623B|nr:tRNA (adenine(58)-N(1))-methyltransferase, mitochondrial-like [Xyrauchen texanus]XP_052009002.1 tRNA (adenine(58)-N(1))-methyltransferase, mitochondrial-like [Xyrauchen texanus]